MLIALTLIYYAPATEGVEGALSHDAIRPSLCASVSLSRRVLSI